MTLICPLCDEVVEDEADWVDSDDMCNTCFEVSGGPKYSCGVMYDDGEDTCRSCGESL
jgi:hypothetical protein